MTYHGEFSAAAQDAEDEPREPDTFGFHGHTITMRDRIGLMTLMRFAAVAVKGVHVGDAEALNAMYEMLEDCIAPEDWPTFVDVARREAVDEEELMAVVKGCTQVVAARPTTRRSASQDGPSSTTDSWRGTSSSPAPTDPRMEGMVPVDRLASVL